MKKLILFATAICLLPGCASVIETSDKAARKFADGVDYYCDNVPETNRDQFRTVVNAYAAPNAVHVHCEGDSE